MGLQSYIYIDNTCLRTACDIEYDVTLCHLSLGVLRAITRHEVEASYHAKCFGAGIVSWPAIYGESFILFMIYMMMAFKKGI